MKANAEKIAAAAMVGTTAMTLFCYTVSKEKNRQFREPELLNSFNPII